MSSTPTNIVVHPETDFPDCLDDYSRGRVEAFADVVDELSGLLPTRHPYPSEVLAAIAWLEQRIAGYRAIACGGAQGDRR